MRFLLLAALLLFGCSEDKRSIVGLHKVTVTPWQERVSCPNGEVMISATTFFWMNGDPKGYELECAKIEGTCQ